MLGAAGESPGDGHRFRYGSFAAQFIFAGASHFSRGNKVGFVEFPEQDRNFRVMQNARVSLPDYFLDLVYGFALRHTQSVRFAAV